MNDNRLLNLAIKKLGRDWSQLNWKFHDITIDGKPDKMSQWQGDPEDDIMVVVFKGNHISEERYGIGMKKLILTLGLLAVFLLCGCGNTAAETKEVELKTDDPVITEESDTLDDENTKPADSDRTEGIDSTSGTTQESEREAISNIVISFDYTRMSGIASNQIAAWVQDEEGHLVKTIYISDFTALRRGYRHRTESLSHWVTAANPESLSDSEIDTVSSATPQAGEQSFTWDLTDESGQRVSDETYYICLEGTLFWGSNVVYTGALDLNEDVPGEMDVQMERSEPDNTDNETMIQNVRMIAMADSVG